MRRFPSSWVSTIGKLGFRRHRQRVGSHKGWRRRRATFECLEPRELLSITSLPAGDFDGDGRVDSATFDTVSRDLTVVPGVAPGSSNVWGQLPAGTWDTFQFGDLNGDGRDDLAVRNSSGSWTFAISESNHFNVVSTGVVTNWTWTQTRVGDFDGNGSQELLGWNPTLSEWRTLGYDDRAGAKLVSGLGNAVHSLLTAGSTLHVGDANRDGRDDLVVRDPSSGEWFVGVSQDTNGGTFVEQNWDNWFAAYSDATGTTVDIDAPYAKLVEVFSDVYNSIELELYPGLMKGPTATAETKAGNAWDQATLLSERLDAAGFEAQIVTGKRRATESETLAWLGAKDVGAALAILTSAIDSGVVHDAANNTFTFQHAWTAVKAPGPFGFYSIFLDPSWKFRSIQPGVALGPNNGSGLLTSFDAFAKEFLFATEDGKFVKDQLPTEAYEDEVMDHLTTTPELTGKSLADIPYDGPIIARRFEQLPVTAGYNSWPSASAIGLLHDGNNWTQDFATLATNPTRAPQWTHRLKVTITTTNGSDSHTLSVPLSGLETIKIWYTDATSGSLIPKLSVGSQTVLTMDPVETDSEVTIEIQHLDPENYSAVLGTLYQKTDSYTRKAGQIVVVSIDANQYSSGRIAQLQADLNSALLSVGSGYSAVIDTDDIDDILGYIGAKYWYNYNADSLALSGLTQTVDAQPRVGSGLVTSDPTFVIQPHLDFPLVPDGVNVDLKNWVLSPRALSTSGDPAAAQVEVLRMAAFNASALENAILEEVINAESISSVKGIQLYLDKGQTTPSTNETVIVFERNPNDSAFNPGGSPRYRRTASADDGGFLDNLSELWTETQLRNFLQTLPTNVVDEIVAKLNTQNALNRIWTPIQETGIPASANAPGWNGIVYMYESIGSTIKLQYLIQQDGAPANGGYRGGAVLPPSPNLELGAFTNQTSAGDPVNVANGNMFRDEVDFRFPSGNLPLDFARHYDSQNPMDVGFGVGWTHSFTGLLYADSDEPDEMTWLRSDGQRHTFKLDNGEWEVPASLFGSFEAPSAANGNRYRFLDKDGTQYLFTPVDFRTDGVANDITTADDYNVRVKGRLTEINYRGSDSDKLIIEYDNATSVRVSQVTDALTNLRRLDLAYDDASSLATVNKVENDAVVATWTYHFDTSFSNVSWPGFTDRRLVKVESPTDQYVTSAAETNYEYYTNGPLARKGLIKKIIEPNQAEWHEYEYYSNGRVFRVTDSTGAHQTFSYNLFRNLTVVTDERGNAETYLHQDNGLLERQIHPDRSRLQFKWGTIDSYDEFLMKESVDERGAKETFTYYQPEESHSYRSSNQNLYRAGELKQSVAKDGIVTNYEYWVSPNAAFQYISELSKIIVAPGANQLVTEFVSRNDRGFATKVKDAEGNETDSEYYSYQASTPAPLRGRLKSQTQPKGVLGNEAVEWQPIFEDVDVTGDTLSVRLLTGDDSNHQVVADAIRIDRMDKDGVFTRIVDNYSTLGGTDPNFRFSPVGAASTYWESSAQTEEYGGDSLVLAGSATVQGSATWIFTELLPGTYRVSATWIEQGGANGRENDAIYQVFDGLPDSLPDLLSTPVNQQVQPTGFHSYQTVFEYDTAGNVVAAVTEGLPAARTSYDTFGNAVFEQDSTGVATINEYDVLGRLARRSVTQPTIINFVERPPVPYLGNSGGQDATGSATIEDDGATVMLTGNSWKVVPLAYQITPETVLEFDFEALAEGEYHGIGFVHSNNSSSTYEKAVDVFGTDMQSYATHLRQYGRYELGSGRVHYRVPIGEHLTAGEFAYLLLINDDDGNTPYNGAGQGISRFSNIALYEPGSVTATTYAYDASGRLKSTTDALNRKTTYHYNGKGNPISTIYADGTYVTRSYDAAGNRVAATDELGRTTQYVYDDRNRLIQTINADGSSTSLRYDGAGNVLESVDELERITSYTYDSAGSQLTRERTLDYDGASESIVEYDEYDPTYGRLSLQTDSNGNITEYGYDQLGRVTSVAALSPASELVALSSTAYDANGNVQQQVIYNVPALISEGASISSIDPTPLIASHPLLVQETTTVYDALGRSVATTNADGTTTSTIYDAAGRVRYSFDELGRKSELQYDEFGRLERSIAPGPDGTASGELPHTRYVRDEFGNVMEEWQYYGQFEGQSNVEYANRYFYDNRNRVVRTVTKDDQHSSRVQFDEAGQVIATTDALENTSYTQYDQRGRVVQQRLPDPDGGGSQIVPVTKFEYDPAGNLVSSTDPLGNVTSFEYDSLNRPRKQLHDETIIADDSGAEDDVEFSVTAAAIYLADATGGYGNDITYAVVPTSNPATQQADWEFTNLAAGTYRVSLPSLSLEGSPDTTLRFLDLNGDPLALPGTTIGAQSSTPDFETVHGDKTLGWHRIRNNGGSAYEIPVTEGDGFIVRMAIGVAYPGSLLIADAVRIDRVVSSSFEYDKNGNLTKETDTRGNVTEHTYDTLNRETLVRLPDPDGFNEGNPRLATQSFYDGYGNVTKIVQFRGFGTADDRIDLFEYDQRNRLTKETINSTGPTAEQLVTEYRYDAVGNETLVIDPSSVETHYRYDELDRVIDEYQDFGEGRPAQAIAFNQSDLVVPIGTATVQPGTSGGSQLTLNGNAFVYAPVDPAQIDFRTILEFELRIDTPPNRIAIAFDNNQVFDAGDEKHWFELGGRSNFIGGFNREFLPDVPLGQAVRVHIPIGQYLADADKSGLLVNQLIFYTDSGSVMEPADAGMVTFSEMRLYQSDEVRTATTYDTRGNVETVRTASDPRNIATRFEYNRAGERTREIYNDGGPLEESYTFVYDVAGNLRQEQNDGAATKIVHEYDGVGRITKTTLPDPDSDSGTPNGLVTTFAHDAAGNVIAETNGEGETTRTAYDSQGRVVSEWDGNGYETRYRYDSEGNLTAVIDAEQNLTRYTYDGMNRETSETIRTLVGATPTDLERQIQYNGAGNVYKIWGRDGRRRQFDYDGLDRVQTEQWFGAQTPANLERVITFEYDKLGRVTRQIDAGGNTGATVIKDDIVETFKYDGLGRLVEQTNYNPDNVGPTGQGWQLAVPDVKMTYDYVFEYAAGSSLWRDRVYRTESLADGTPLGKTQLTYDELARLSDVSDFDASTSTGPTVAWKQLHFAYNAAGDLRLVRHYANYSGSAWQNVFDTALTYDEASRVKSITHDIDSSGSTTDIVHTYDYDNASRVTSFDTMGTGAASRGYGYDNAGQLTSKTGGTTESYEYDDNGNRSTVDSQAITTSTANRLTNDGTYTYDYDNEGNLIRRTPIATPSAADPVAVYGYDQRNRLTSERDYLSDAEADAKVNWIRLIGNTYDLQGHRIRRTLDSNGAAAGGVTYEYYVYDGDELALRYGNAGELTHRYVYGPAVDQVLADEVFTAGAGGERTSDAVLWQLGDHQGTIRDLVDDMVVRRKHVDYDSFGNITGEEYYRADGTPIGDPVDVDFQAITSYAPGAQDFDTDPTSAVVSGGGSQLSMQNNIWKAVEIDYTITPHTVLEFDFASSVEGEIHAIGFDDDLSYGGAAAGETYFKVHGTDLPNGWLEDDDYAPTAPDVKHYTIQVGQFTTGAWKYLVLVNDKDAGPLTHDSQFANVRLYESDAPSSPALHPEAVDQLFQFQGQEWDQDAKLQQNGTRWYDPSIGRFLSEDPSGLDGGDANLYRYVGNSPLNYTDPTGLVQAGNPLDALFGGFSGNSVAPANSYNPPIFATAGSPVDNLLSNYGGGALFPDDPINPYLIGNNIPTVNEAMSYFTSRPGYYEDLAADLYTPSRQQVEQAYNSKILRDVSRINVEAELGHFVQDPLVYNPRANGVVRTATGAAQISAGLLAATVPVVGPIFTAAIGVRGADNFATGISQIATGRFQETKTGTAFVDSLEYFGVSSTTAKQVGAQTGAAVDLVTSLIGAAGPRALRPTHIKTTIGETLQTAVPSGGRGIWDLSPESRWTAVEQQLGKNLPSNYPVIDKFNNGVATSIKSLDLGAPTYARPDTIARVGRGYIDKVAGFKGRDWARVSIRAEQIAGRGLDLAVPPGATAAQRNALRELVTYGRQKGVSVNIVETR